MKVVDLDRETVKQGLADGSLLLIDVREDHEFARGRIPGSVSHPLSSFDPEALKALIAADGRRPVFGTRDPIPSAPGAEEALLFHEFFDGDTGRGLGASHQTGWTALILNLLHTRARRTAG